MKATLERTDLLKSLTHVHRVVERRNTIPILSNVLLRADGGAINLKATDLDLEIVETAPALKGASATNRTKPATLSNGVVVQVPEYLAAGEIIRVNTETGKFMSRAK